MYRHFSLREKDRMRGCKIQGLGLSDPHPSPLPEGEGVCGTAVMLVYLGIHDLFRGSLGRADQAVVTVATARHVYFLS